MFLEISVLHELDKNAKVDVDEELDNYDEKWFLY